MRVLLSLFSLVTLFANQQMASENVDTVRRAAWYDKKHPTFTDALALARRELWAREEATFCGSAQENDMVKVPRELIEANRRGLLCSLMAKVQLRPSEFTLNIKRGILPLNDKGEGNAFS